MLIDKNQSVLLLIDVQEKLIPAIHEHQLLVANCAWLSRLANELAVPIVASEQYPQGLGSTVATLKNIISEQQFMSKTTFSCTADTTCQSILTKMKKSQIIIAGIEAHVCVLQTAMSLKEQGKNVFVVAEAISSRHPYDKELAIKRMQAAGITIVNKEMVFFEWIHDAKNPKFKELSKTFLR